MTMSDNASGSDADGDAPGADVTAVPPRRTGRWILVAAAAATALVALGAAVVVFGGDGAGDAAAESCPPEQEPTGVTSPESEPDDPAGMLSVANSGFAPSTDRDVDLATEKSAFGYLLENTSDLALYDARVSFRLVDGDGEDPTEELPAGQREENEYYLDNIHVPVLLPGQQVGLGGTVITWSSLAEDADSGEFYEPDEVDYDALDVEVVAAEGEWWELDNDTHHFVGLPPAEASVVDEGPEVDATYLDGTPGANPEFGFEVDSPYCGDLEAYDPTAVAYDDAGNIVGGTISHAPQPEPELTYPAGVSEGHSLSLLVPDTELTVSVFVYPEPETPELTQ